MRQTAAALLAASLGACGWQAGGYGAEPAAPLPYDVCPASVPDQPFCLALGEPFASVERARACAVDVDAFVAALKRWRRCQAELMTSAYNRWANEAAATLACLPDTNSVSCASVDVRIDRFENLPEPLVAPYCIRQPAPPPEREWAVEQCDKEVQQFSERARRAIAAFIASSEVQRLADAAMRKFECLLRHEPLCM